MAPQERSPAESPYLHAGPESRPRLSTVDNHDRDQTTVHLHSALHTDHVFHLNFLSPDRFCARLEYIIVS